MYRQTPVPISPRAGHTLAALRILFIALVLALFLRPVLALTVEGSIRRLLVVLVDTSASMQIRDPRLDAPEQKRAAIARGSLDPQKGMSQSLIAQRLASLSRSHASTWQKPSSKTSA